MVISGQGLVKKEQYSLLGYLHHENTARSQAVRASSASECVEASEAHVC